MSRELYEGLKQREMLRFGSHIPGDLVREILDIRYPETGTKKQFDEIALIELSAMDYVRNALLNEGKYLAGIGGDYRILLPSENKLQVERYMASADRKLRRAGKLSRNTPSASKKQHDNVAARIMLKRESIRRTASLRSPKGITGGHLDSGTQTRPPARQEPKAGARGDGGGPSSNPPPRAAAGRG